MYAIDLDQLDETLAELVRCAEALDAVLGDVSRRVDVLHETWSGAAAVAQSGAQERWEAGFRAMREGLAAMRTGGELAGESYGDAAATNVHMWGQLA